MNPSQRSGRRRRPTWTGSNRSSAAAAGQKLVDIGYANACEFGGIIDWTGEIVLEEAAGLAKGWRKRGNKCKTIQRAPVFFSFEFKGDDLYEIALLGYNGAWE